MSNVSNKGPTSERNVKLMLICSFCCCRYRPTQDTICNKWQTTFQFQRSRNLQSFGEITRTKECKTKRGNGSRWYVNKRIWEFKTILRNIVCHLATNIPSLETVLYPVRWKISCDDTVQCYIEVRFCNLGCCWLMTWCSDDSIMLKLRKDLQKLKLYHLSYYIGTPPSSIRQKTFIEQ